MSHVSYVIISFLDPVSEPNPNPKNRAFGEKKSWSPSIYRNYTNTHNAIHGISSWSEKPEFLRAATQRTRGK